MRSLAPLAVTLGLLLSARVASAQQPTTELVILFEPTARAIRLHDTLSGGAEGAMRALRAELGDRARIVRRATLGRPLDQCDVAETECAERIVRALGGARVLHVRVDQTRGGCVPIVRDGQRVGSRMLLATEVTAGWLGDAPAQRGHVEPGADAERLLEVLLSATRDAMAPPAPAE